MQFSLDFANNTISPCFFSFFLIIDLYFLNPTAIVQMFNPIADLVITIAIPSKESKVKIEIHPVIVKLK